MEILKKLSIFFSTIIIFALMYYFSGNDLTISEAFVLSTSFQTFNGANVLEFNEKVKIISIVQMIFSYVFIVIILYNFAK
jgi:hypothetical protein